MNHFEKHKVEYNREDTQIRFMEYIVPQFPAHWHLDAEIIMATSGTINIGYNFDIYTLNEGDFMLIPGGNIHYFNTSNDGKALLLLFDAEAIVSEEERDGFSIPVIIRNIDISMFKDIYDRIYREIINADTAYKVFIRSYMSLISGWIMRNRTAENIIRSKQIKHTLLNDSQKLFTYIEENYNKKITLDTGAEFMHFDKKYFCRYFKALTGTTFARYVNNVRGQSAQNMLRNTGLPIYEIALRCGFNTVRTFNREFRAFSGLTATQYRQRKNFE